MQILGLLAEQGEMSVADLQLRLKRSGNDLAYTTVMTVLVRLNQKGLALRTKDGRRYLYSAAAKAPAVSRGILSRIQRTLFQGDRTRPIMTLLDDATISRDELRALRRHIDDKLKEKP